MKSVDRTLISSRDLQQSLDTFLPYIILMGECFSLNMLFIYCSLYSNLNFTTWAAVHYFCSVRNSPLGAFRYLNVFWKAYMFQDTIYSSCKRKYSLSKGAYAVEDLFQWFYLAGTFLSFQNQHDFLSTQFLLTHTEFFQNYLLFLELLSRW